MYQTRINERKKQAVQKIYGMIAESKHFVFTNYSGLTVEQITDLRGKLQESSTSYHVVKNSYAKLAFTEHKHEGVSDMMLGPTAVALVQEDVVPVLKVLFEFSKETKLEVKGGVVDNNVFAEVELQRISKLPSLPELQAKLMATALAPAQNLVGVLSGVMQKLVRVLNAVSEVKK